LVSIEEELKRAKSLKDKGQTDRAKEILQSLLKQITDDWRIWNELGHTHVRAGEFSDAKDAFESAIQLEPDRSGLWNNKGFTLKEMGDLTGAIDSTRKAKSTAKESRDIKTAEYNLACYLSLSGKTEQALDHLRRACADDDSIKEWARQDLDFVPIKSDPRFKEIVG
jgi:Flp pilus assembly protein TadD